LVITFSEVEPLQVEDDDEIDFGDLDDEVQPTAARRCSCLTTAIGVVGLAAIAYVSPWAGLAGVCTYGAYRIRKLF
ncbi:MAG TPA: hypothetical protein VLG44_06460, partial [Chlamydiales bacterium]|nr:hypothetical protein [Chlamydiales bacterium]